MAQAPVTARKLGVGIPIDTDAINPACLKATIGVIIDNLEIRANNQDGGAIALNWNSLEFALYPQADGVTTHAVVRAEIL